MPQVGTGKVFEKLVDSMRGELAATAECLTTKNGVTRSTVSNFLETALHRKIVEVIGYIRRPRSMRVKVYRLRSAERT